MPGQTCLIIIAFSTRPLAHEDFYDYAGHCTAEGKKKIAEAIVPQIMEILESASDK